jgi:hypothetical protein
MSDVPPVINGGMVCADVPPVIHGGMVCADVPHVLQACKLLDGLLHRDPQQRFTAAKLLEKTWLRNDRGTQLMQPIERMVGLVVGAAPSSCNLLNAWE